MTRLGIPAMIVLLLSFAAVRSSAQTVLDDTTRVSDVLLHVTNVGTFGRAMTPGGAGFEYPRGSGNTYLSGGGIWFGCRKAVGTGGPRTVVFETYDPATGSSWAVPGYTYDSTLAQADIFNSTLYDHQSGEYIGPNGPRSRWPMWTLLTEPGATPRSPGHFKTNPLERDAGDRYVGPTFLPGADEEIITQFNDFDTTRYGGRRDPALPIGLLIRQYISGWAEGPLASTVVFTYSVINVSQDTLYNCFVGPVYSPVVGDGSATYSYAYTSRPELRTTVAYQSGVGTTPPGALLTTLLEGPLTYPPGDTLAGFVDNANRNRFRYNGRITSYRNLNLNTDPPTLADLYGVMASMRVDGSIGRNDQGALMTSGPFNMLPGDTAHLSFALRVADVANPQDTTDNAQIEAAARQVIDYFYVGSPSATPAVSASGASMLIAPNPTSGSSTIDFSVDRSSPVTISLFDELGRTVAKRQLGVRSAGTYRERLPVEGLSSGAYVVAVQTGNRVATGRLVIAK